MSQLKNLDQDRPRILPPLSPKYSSGQALPQMSPSTIRKTIASLTGLGFAMFPSEGRKEKANQKHKERERKKLRRKEEKSKENPSSFRPNAEHPSPKSRN